MIALAQVPAPQTTPGQRSRGSKVGAAVASSQCARSESDSQYRLGPDSMPQEGVPKGEIHSAVHVTAATCYPVTQRTYWVYVPAPVRSDGSGWGWFIRRSGLQDENQRNSSSKTMMDNLIYRPRDSGMMIGMFIQIPEPQLATTSTEPTPHELARAMARRTRAPTEYKPR